MKAPYKAPFGGRFIYHLMGSIYCGKFFVFHVSLIPISHIKTWQETRAPPQKAGYRLLSTQIPLLGNFRRRESDALPVCPSEGGALSPCESLDSRGLAELRSARSPWGSTGLAPPSEFRFDRTGAILGLGDFSFPTILGLGLDRPCITANKHLNSKDKSNLY